MKKNITINLYGTLVAIDEDACKLLEQYLDNMKRYFSKREGGEEIADDIEHRVAELFSELKAEGTEAISIEHVQDIIHRIGNPEDMDDEEAEKAGPSESTKSDNTQSDCGNDHSQSDARHKNLQDRACEWISRRRLYRDPGDKMLGGVLSGLCAYFGANDPLPWRIIFVILTIFSWSALAIVYLVLWALIPEARTAEEKLLMHGHPVNPQTINEQMLRENNIETSATGCAKQSRAPHRFLNLCLIVVVFCFKLLLLFVATGVMITLIILGIILIYSIYCTTTSITDTSNAFSELIISMSLDRSIMWQYLASLVCGLTSIGILLFGTLRWTFHSRDSQPASGTKIAALGILAVVLLTVGITLCTTASTRFDKTYEEYTIKQNSKGGYYMTEYDREKLADKGWEVIAYAGCNDEGRVFYDTSSWLKDDGRDEYMRFEKIKANNPMKVDVRRTDSLPQGYYHVEAVATARGNGAKINILGSGASYCSLNIPKVNDNYQGNMEKMTYEEFLATDFGSSTLTEEDWKEFTHERVSDWSYLRSNSFWHKGGNITTQLTAGIGADAPHLFSVRSVRIVPETKSETEAHISANAAANAAKSAAAKSSTKHKATK